LGTSGWQIIEVRDAGDALRELGHGAVEACVVDLVEGRGGLTATRLLRARQRHLTTVGLVDVANAASVAEALHAGIVDLLPWPASPVEMAQLLAALRDRGPIAGGGPLGMAEAPVFALSPAMRVVVDRLGALAATCRSVCLSGEEGTGRRRLARELHRLGGGAEAHFVAVDPSGRTPGEIEAELFGTAEPPDPSQLDRLAPASAIARAIGGTIYLSHLGDAAMRLQSRLTRLLRDGEAEIDHVRMAVDLRFVASLDVALDEAVAEGRVRRDLADRLSEVEVPALRERTADLPLLAQRLLDDAAVRAGRGPLALSRSAAALLAALPWPGNVAELETLVGNLVDTSGPVVLLEDVLTKVRLGGDLDRVDLHLPLREARVQFERQCIAAALTRHRGRMSEAARALGIQRTNLYRKMRQLRLNRGVPGGHD
jgi:two-component system nitrogen regulation response regulator NtrX